MKYAVITDSKFRSAIPVCRAFAKMGYTPVPVQTEAESGGNLPPVFYSKYVNNPKMIEGSAKDERYIERLTDLLREYQDPVLFCTGADTQRTVSQNREHFEKYAKFVVADISAIDGLNDKEKVHFTAKKLGIPVPRQYEGEPQSYPVIVKPHCGERFGLKASERYGIAQNREQFDALYKKMQKYDERPIVQQKVEGDGIGACILIDKKGRLINGYCHRRIREYPVSGGPSTCCDSFYDKELIENAYRLLREFDFCGMAMVEFKGKYLLEVNPRLWGSFPLSECADTGFTVCYARAAEGEKVPYRAGEYKIGARMHFVLNDALAVIGYLKKGRIKTALIGIKDMIFAKEALFSAKDPKPFFKYLKNNLKRTGQ